ncbi:MAG: glycosyltransferase family 2 protein [Candidatus Nealsonbacteria bacterium]|nr:glycosyltransferase family 2 protein [Candidatus Nealsonbacteria bacterium]
MHLRPPARSSLTIIIPAYNEEAGIGKTLQSLRGEPGLAGAQIVVVDDGSSDRTGEIAAEHGATVISNWTNLGYGASLKRGILATDSELIAWFDADGQHDPGDLAEMVRRLDRERAQAVIGARGRLSHVVRQRVIGKRIIKWAAEAAVGRRIPDVNCGLRVFRRRALIPYLGLLPDGFSASTTSTLLFVKQNAHVVFHPVHVSQRVGKSSVRMIRDGFRTLHTILRITIMFNALKAFSMLAGLMILCGLLYGAVLSLIQGDGFPVLAALTVLMGVQIFCLGVVCDQISAMRLERLRAGERPEEDEIDVDQKKAA